MGNKFFVKWFSEINVYSLPNLPKWISFGPALFSFIFRPFEQKDIFRIGRKERLFTSRAVLTKNLTRKTIILLLELGPISLFILRTYLTVTENRPVHHFWISSNQIDYFKSKRHRWYRRECAGCPHPFKYFVPVESCCIRYLTGGPYHLAPEVMSHVLTFKTI